MIELCQRIKDECDKRGRTLSSVMAKADLSSSIIYKWKDGSAKPKPQSIRSIAEALGMPAKTLAPEMSEAFDALDAEVVAENIDAEGISEDFVFVGMRKSALATLRPFIERANAGLVEVPRDLVKGLVTLMQSSSNSW